MGCGCHAVNRTSVKRQPVKSKVLTKNIISSSSYLSDNVRKVIRRSIKR